MSDERERIEAWLKAHEKPEIHIDYAKPDAPIPVGASKIGGCPDVPAGFVWPRHKDSLGVSDKARKDMERPIAFMAQFNLAEVAAFDTQGLLPKAGHLLFFYDYECFDDGGALCTEGSASRIMYFPPGTALERMALPDDMGEDCDFPELALTFSTRISRPVSNDWPDEVLGKTGSDDDEYDGYDDDDEYEEHNKAEQGCKLLGHPFTIQNPVEDDCQIAFMGIEWEALENPETKAAMEAGMDDWMLLFQFDSIEVEGYADIMFYDCGALYFWIRKQDLAAGDFTHAYRCVQFH